MILIEIAGIAVAIEIADAPKRGDVGERYREFIVPEAAPQATVRVEVSDDARFIPLDPGPWVMDVTYDRGRLNYRSHLDAGWMDIERGECFLRLAPEADIENFLRVLYAHLCLRAGGLLLHAAGVIEGGAGFVFFAPSGGGKTTSARLSLDDTAPRTVLSDDLVILKTDGDGVRVCGVPFRGDFPEAPRVNAAADLRGLFTLVKSPEHGMAGVTRPEAIARLLGCVPFVMVDGAHTKRAIEICSRINERVPVRALRFRPDPGFWRVIHGS